MAKSLEEMLSSVDPALLHPADAVRILVVASDVEQRAAALKTLVAGRAAEGGEWARGATARPRSGWPRRPALLTARPPAPSTPPTNSPSCRPLPTPCAGATCPNS